MNLKKLLIVLVILLVVVIAAGSYYTPKTTNSNGGSQPEIKHSDSDGLNDSFESKIGTSPYSADTDGDGLPDDWEVQAPSTNRNISNSDPLHKDLYLQVNYGKNVTHLSEAEIERLKSYWAEMAVENPDGVDGIQLHIDDEPPGGGDIGLDLPLEGYGITSLSYDKLESLARQYYGRQGTVQGQISSSRQCVYHQMILVESTFPHDVEGNLTYTLGKATPGGKFSIVMGDSKEGTVMLGPKHPSRLSIMTHELLHNVAGSYHTNTSSWLAPATPAIEPRLSNKTETILETEGFDLNSCSM